MIVKLKSSSSFTPSPRKNLERNSEYESYDTPQDEFAHTGPKRVITCYSLLILSGKCCKMNIMPSQKRSCMICGKAIDEYLPRTQKYCSDRKCIWKYFDRIRQRSRDALESLKREREKLNKEVLDLRSDAAEAAGIQNLEDFIPVAIPINLRRIRHLPEKRRRTFCDRLKQLNDQATAEHRSSTHLTDDSTMQTKHDAQMQSTELHSILSVVCAVCRGSCCKNGGDHGYIKVDTLVRYMRQHPELQPHQVLEEYLSFLPKKTYEDSCVYHTRLGCSLPRHMRYEGCELYACHGLADIKEHVIDTKSTRFFIASMKGKNILLSAFIEGNKIRGHRIYCS